MREKIGIETDTIINVNNREKKYEEKQRDRDLFIVLARITRCTYIYSFNINNNKTNLCGALYLVAFVQCIFNRFDKFHFNTSIYGTAHVFR